MSQEQSASSYDYNIKNYSSMRTPKIESYRQNENVLDETV